MFPLKFPSQTSKPASARRKPEQKTLSSPADLSSRFTEGFGPVSDHPVGRAGEQSVLEEDDRSGLGEFSVVTVEAVDSQDVAVRSHHSVLSSFKPGLQDHLHLNIYSSSSVQIRDHTHHHHHHLHHHQQHQHHHHHTITVISTTIISTIRRLTVGLELLSDGAKFSPVPVRPITT